ncbi:MAG: NlpC/P60 family protein [Pseudomonadota bacterium]
MMADRCSADRVVAVARRWVGTPYRHQASLEGIGADCLGLVRGIWREVVGAEPEAVPAYTADWAESREGERLMAATARVMRAVPAASARPGDVLLFRMKARGVAKHLGILAAGTPEAGRLIHAYAGHAVCETAIGPAWARRLAGCFRFPLTDGTETD